MADSGGLDGKDICTGILNILGVEVANIKGVGGKDKKTCATCTAITLGSSNNCRNACGDTHCVTYYTEGTVGALETGDHLYENEDCSLCSVEAGHYSDRGWDGAQRECFTVGLSCQITEVSRC